MICIPILLWLLQVFGVHVPLLEIDDMLAIHETIKDIEIKEKKKANRSKIF